jgi:hypothetical protein
MVVSSINIQRRLFMIDKTFPGKEQIWADKICFYQL